MSESTEALAAFLAARLDEIEATASYAGPARIAWLTLLDDNGQLRYTTVAAAQQGDGDGWIADGKEVPAPALARVVYDPAAVRRDIEADRKLLDLLERAIAYRDRVFAQPPPRSVSDEMRAVTQMMALEQVVKIRAERFSDHPDWKP